MDISPHNHQAFFNTKNVNFKYWPSQFIIHDKIVISLGKRTFWVTKRHPWFKVQYRVKPPRARMTASTHRLIPPVSRRMCCYGSCRHSRCSAGSNWRNCCTGGSTACTRRSSMSQTCSIEFKSRLMAGHERNVTALLWRKTVTALERCGNWL